jgi:hypothetical protein
MSETLRSDTDSRWERGKKEGERDDIEGRVGEIMG